MSRFTKIAALAVFTAALAPVALAEKPVTASTPVSYADLNLSSPAGVQTLLRRIEIASKKVCGKRPTTARLGQLEDYLGCREAAMNEAVETINNPTVTMAWAGKAGRTIRVAFR